jgi:hypothetical protein
VAIKGLSDKRNITVTFVITLAGDILPLQIIYGGKTKASLSRFKFPKDFLYHKIPSIGPTSKKHWS